MRGPGNTEKNKILMARDPKLHGMHRIQNTVAGIGLRKRGTYSILKDKKGTFVHVTSAAMGFVDYQGHWVLTVFCHCTHGSNIWSGQSRKQIKGLNSAGEKI